MLAFVGALDIGKGTAPIRTAAINNRLFHRARFEPFARSIWVLYAASDDQIFRLTASLSLDSEQAAKNMPQLAEVMQDLKGQASL